MTVAKPVASDGRALAEVALSAHAVTAQTAIAPHPNEESLVPRADGAGRVLAERLSPAGAPIGVDDIVVIDGTEATTVAAGSTPAPASTPSRAAGSGA